MTYNMLMAGLSLALLLAVGSVVSVDSPQATLPESVVIDQPLVLNQGDESCGDEPAYSENPSVDLTDEWYQYGDCSGYYGPIDAEGASLPSEEAMWANE